MNFAITGLDDAAHLAALHQSAFAPSLGTPWDEAAFANLLRQNSVQALGTQAGFILFQTVAEEAEILTLAVHPKARRSGLARALYAACGFTQTGLRPAYYKRPDGTRVDALVLQLQTEG